MKLMMTGKSDQLAGVMIPIPQYPLYTATIAEYNAHTVSKSSIIFRKLVLRNLKFLSYRF